MRIFFITHTYSIGGSGGGEQFVSSFLQELRKRKHEVYVFTPGGKEYLEKEKKLGIQVCHFPVIGHHAFHKYIYTKWWPIAAMKAREFKPDVIHAQNDAFPGLIGHFVKAFTGAPLVVSVEYLSDQAVSLNLKLVFAINKFLLPKLNYDIIVSWSSFVVEKFFKKWGIPSKKIRIIPGAVNLKPFLAKSIPHPKLARKGKNWIVSPKPLHSTNAKGISYIIKAMALVAKKHPDWKYAIVGEGTAKHGLKQLVKELGLEKNVIFFGGMQNSQISSVYSAAEIVAHSFAFKATTSIALIESMAAGKAIVATASGEVRPTVGDSALTPKMRDEKSIARALLRLIENPALRKELGKKARARAKELYSIESVVDRFEELYKGLK